MDVHKRIGWNLRRLRKEQEITQEDFATDSGFDRGYISGVERGVRNPSVKVLVRIADSLKVDVADLFDADKAAEFAYSHHIKAKSA
ncbi:helix-turn-helix transcriptional regulator [Sandaracinobacter neustonicus]|uniref:Helix-turn-helix transcriptional regulator n=1 Tax=Sandaracinobacter neustonicus TaxID=1715348 RepID=A0A501XRB5_9SPHN|nr:helix-turn-helix transcriptional regulator [Sandaracinobacter neustonicus]TPE63096.1 helix-turn-helix transcriptional regulator [Sandaracinobacter neustonicus]